MKRIIAVDFDGTLCTNDYPNVGRIYKGHKMLHKILQQEKEYGSTIILWTCRTGKHLQDAIEACKKWGVPIDYVNENDPELIELFGGDTRKIVATVYIDDRGFTPLNYINDIYTESEDNI